MEEKLVSFGILEGDADEPSVHFECTVDEAVTIGRIISKYPQNDGISTLIGWEVSDG